MGINAWPGRERAGADGILSGRHEVSSRSEDTIKAYCLRDFYMELLSLVIYLTAGPDHMRKVSLEVRRFFQKESFVEYARKLDAQRASPPVPAMEKAE